MTIKHKITFPPEVHHRAAMSRLDGPSARALDALEINLGQQPFQPFQPGPFLDVIAAAVAEHAIIEPFPPTPITRDQIVKGMTVVASARGGWTCTVVADHQDADGNWLDADGWNVTSYGWTYATYDELPDTPAERMAAALGVEPGAIRQALTDAGLDLSEWKP